jgi:transposase
MMRGTSDPQSILFTAAIQLDERIRADHPLRAIKRMVDEDLRKMSKRFDAAYASDGRPSVPPERLIKALLLQSIYSIRSEAQLVERIDHDLLFRWFLDLRSDEPVFDATVFYRSRHIGHQKTGQQAHIAGAAFNLIRMRSLATG